MRRQVTEEDGPATTHRRCVVQHMAKLAHIARPGIGLQCGKSRRGELNARGGTPQFQEISAEHRYIAGALVQRWYGNGQCAESVKDLCSQGSVADGFAWVGAAFQSGDTTA